MAELTDKDLFNLVREKKITLEKYKELVVSKDEDEDEDKDPLVEAIKSMEDTFTKLLKNLPQPIVKVSPPVVNVDAPKIEMVEPIKEWEFEITRDSKGNITNIKAIAVE